MRTWTRLVPAVLLAVPLTMASVRAADPELTTEQKIAQLRKDVEALRQELKDLRSEVRASSVRGARTAEDIGKMLALMERMANAQQDLVTRRSAYAPTPMQDDVPPALTGTITVRNQYTTAATIHLNGRSFPVGPGQTAKIPGVPVGPVNYEVEVDGYGVVQPLRTETLRPNGRIITIYPQFGG